LEELCQLTFGHHPETLDFLKHRFEPLFGITNPVIAFVYAMGESCEAVIAEQPERTCMPGNEQWMPARQRFHGLFGEMQLSANRIHPCLADQAYQ
jgi:hypothetical protein